MRARRVTAIGLACAACGLALPSAAGAQCHTPKGWYVASAQFQYSLYTESGQEVQSAQQLSGSMPSPTRDGIKQFLLALSHFSSVSADHGAGLAGASATFAISMATATADDPPGCDIPPVKRRHRAHRR